MRLRDHRSRAWTATMSNCFFLASPINYLNLGRYRIHAFGLKDALVRK